MLFNFIRLGINSDYAEEGKIEEVVFNTSLSFRPFLSNIDHIDFDGRNQQIVEVKVANSFRDIFYLIIDCVFDLEPQQDGVNIFHNFIVEPLNRAELLHVKSQINYNNVIEGKIYKLSYKDIKRLDTLRSWWNYKGK